MVLIEEEIVVWDVVRDKTRFAAAFALHRTLGCGSFSSTVQDVNFIAFMRRIVAIVEDELQCANYHLRVTPLKSGSPIPRSKKGQLTAPLDGLVDHASAAGFYVSVYGDPER